MLSGLDDNTNKLLLELLQDMLNMSPYDLTIKSDNEVLSIFLKLAFQHRQNTGMFGSGFVYEHQRMNIDLISNQLASLELLK